MRSAPEVVIIGGGVAGASLACGLASHGLQVVVIERERRFTDRVRGEYLAPWGVEEASQLGLLEELDERATTLARMRLLDSADGGEDDVVELDNCVPGVDGARGIGHPTLCEILVDQARLAGAEVLTDTRSSVELAPRPTVRTHEGRVFEPRIVVGADGSNSSVRLAVGLGWQRRASAVFGAGMLVEGYRGPADVACEGTAGDAMSYIIPQGDDRARLYLNYCTSEGPSRLGTPRRSGFLQAFPADWAPGSSFAPAGPCRVVPLTDGWPDSVVAPGAVLVGDAAGHCNPILGQGLAMALRDAEPRHGSAHLRRGARVGAGTRDPLREISS